MCTWSKWTPWIEMKHQVEKAPEDGARNMSKWGMTTLWLPRLQSKRLSSALNKARDEYNTQFQRGKEMGMNEAVWRLKICRECVCGCFVFVSSIKLKKRQWPIFFPNSRTQRAAAKENDPSLCRTHKLHLGRDASSTGVLHRLTWQGRKSDDTAYQTVKKLSVTWSLSYHRFVEEQHRLLV